MSNESEAQHASSWAHDTHPEAHQHDANIKERAPSIHDVFNIWELYRVKFPNVIIDEQLLERIQPDSHFNSICTRRVRGNFGGYAST